MNVVDVVHEGNTESVARDSHNGGGRAMALSNDSITGTVQYGTVCWVQLENGGGRIGVCRPTRLTDACFRCLEPCSLFSFSARLTVRNSKGERRNPSRGSITPDANLFPLLLVFIYHATQQTTRR